MILQPTLHSMRVMMRVHARSPARTLPCTLRATAPAADADTRGATRTRPPRAAARRTQLTRLVTGVAPPSAMVVNPSVW